MIFPFFVTLASLYNFADDKTLSIFAITVSRLIKILESESEFVIDCLKENKVVVNPDKFQAITNEKVFIPMNILLLTFSKLKLYHL